MKKQRAIEWLYKEFPVLIQSGIISQKTADNLRQYYGEVRNKNKLNVALAIFGVIGAVSIGLGIILLFAYNWDKLNRMQRILMAFAPLIISCGLLGWSIFTDKKSLVIREGFSVFNMLSVGGAMALMTQIYHFSGDIDNLLLTWMILSLPLVYLMSSNLVAILYLVGITSWASISQISGNHAVFFWPLIGLIFPHYLKYLFKDKFSSVSVWLSSALCLCFTVAIGISLEKTLPGLWIIIYSAFYAILYLIHKFWFDDVPAGWQKPFRNYGMLGILILSYMCTYKWVWRSIGWNYFRLGGKFHELAGMVDYGIAGLLIVLAISLLVKAWSKKYYFEMSFGLMPILSIIVYSVVSGTGNIFIAISLYNIYILFLGIVCVIYGMKDKQLGMMNVGILIMSLIIFTRFLDSSFGIMTRGIIFIVVGSGFILTNIMMAKKIKQEVGHDK